MRKILLVFCFAAVVFLPACKYAHGDGPDVAAPRYHKNKNPDISQNPRKSNWLTENANRERVGRKNINKTSNDNFQVFPHRDKRRSDNVRKQSSPFFWK